MAVSIVNVTLSATLGGTTDAEVAGFGTPSAAIVIVTQASTVVNPTPNSIVSVGFWDGNNQSVSSITSRDALDVTSTFSLSRKDYIAAAVNVASSTWNFGYSCTARPNGIRLTLDVDNTTTSKYCTVILIKDVPAKLLTFVPNATVNATQVSTSLGFAPKALLATSIGFAGPTALSGGTQTTNAMLSFGAALRNNTQRMVTWYSRNSLSVAEVTELFSDNQIAGQSTSSINWQAEVTTWGSDTFTITTRTGSPGTDDIYILALGGDDWLDLGTITTSTTTGAVDTTTAYTPSALLMIGTGSDVTNTLVSDARASTFSIGAASSTNNYGYALVDEDAAGITNTESAFSATNALYLRTSTAGTAANLVLASATFGASKFTLNYTTVSATARKGWWLAFADNPVIGIDVSVTGVQVIGAVGAVVVSLPINVSLSGVEATGVIGTATPLIVTIANVSGVQSTGVIGTVIVSILATVDVLGVGATAAVGDVSVALGKTVSPTGVVGYGLIGSVNVWGLVDDSQTPGWSIIPNTQVSPWGAVPTPQVPNWQQIVS